MDDFSFNDTLPEDHRSGVVAVIGKPNVGKSTLINAILGQKIAITTPKPQTTRQNQLGIYTTENEQILFVDTPGLHKPHNDLGDFMTSAATDALRDADVNLWILDVSAPPTRADQIIAETLNTSASSTPVVLVLNKIDAAKSSDYSAYTDLIDHTAAFPVSALKGDGVQELLTAVVEMMPHGPRYYPADQVSDQNLRFIAAEVIREKIMLNTEQEIPHSVAVNITAYREEDHQHAIEATIYVERDSQKAIIIGKGGSMIKKIGTEARHELMKLFDTTVHLDLHVKVLKNWRSDENLMKRVGYRKPGKDN